MIIMQYFLRLPYNPGTTQNAKDADITACLRRLQRIKFNTSCRLPSCKINLKRNHRGKHGLKEIMSTSTAA